MSHESVVHLEARDRNPTAALIAPLLRLRSDQLPCAGHTGSQRCEQPIGRLHVGGISQAAWNRNSYGPHIRYPLVNIEKTMENHHFSWENSL